MAAPRSKELRWNPDAELRAETADGDVRKIVGYAAVFDKPTDLYFGVREVIRRGAFKTALEKKSDIRAFWNHDSNIVLGRTKSGTLTLTEDERGLHAEITPPASASQYVESIERGDVSQMSFGFRVVKDAWTKESETKMLREIQDVELFEVSPVAFPAYKQTSVKVRSVLEDFGIDGEVLADALQGQHPEIISVVRELSSALRMESS